MNKKKMMMFEIMSGNSGGGGADVSGVTATAPDVDEGKIFVDNTGSQVVGTSTYKADYIALRTDIDNLNDTLEPVLLGDGSDTNVYANVSNVTATAGDVATGKVFVNNSGQEVTGTAINSTAEFIKMIERNGTNAYKDNITIPYGTTRIGTMTFYRYSYLANVNIPDTVTSIGSDAFNGDTYFDTPKLPDNLTSIGSDAFNSCPSLKISNIPSGVTTLGQAAFKNCSNITISTIPAGITDIRSQTFYSCTSITQITFLGTPTTINNTAFQYCSNLTTIRVPWQEGAVSNAPWGATNATIVYDYTPS